MKRFPLDKFPKNSLRPEVVIKHDEHMGILEGDIEEYSKVGQRDQSMYDWLLRVFENCGLSTIKREYLESLAIVKTRLAMFVVLIDDTVDNAEKHDFRLFEELIKIPFELDHIKTSDLDEGQIKCLNFAKHLWVEISSEFVNYPHYEKYKEALNFDLRELIGSMDYSRFVNGFPNAVNGTENSAHTHHGMMVLIQVDLDLMCSENFDDNELGKLRELTYLSQKMAKKSNSIGSYTRELLESDMSSEIVVKFVNEHGVNFKFLLNKLLNREHRYPEFEEILIKEWQNEYQTAKKMALHIKSIDTELFMNERMLIQNAYYMKLLIGNSS